MLTSQQRYAKMNKKTQKTIEKTETSKQRINLK